TGELRGKGIHRHLQAKSRVHLRQRECSRQLALVSHRVVLNPTDRFFFDGDGSSVRTKDDVIEWRKIRIVRSRDSKADNSTQAANRTCLGLDRKKCSIAVDIFDSCPHPVAMEKLRRRFKVICIENAPCAILQILIPTPEYFGVSAGRNWNGQQETQHA